MRVVLWGWLPSRIHTHTNSIGLNHQPKIIILNVVKHAVRHLTPYHRKDWYHFKDHTKRKKKHIHFQYGNSSETLLDRCDPAHTLLLFHLFRLPFDRQVHDTLWAISNIVLLLWWTVVTVFGSCSLCLIHFRVFSFDEHCVHCCYCCCCCYCRCRARFRCFRCLAFSLWCCLLVGSLFLCLYMCVFVYKCTGYNCHCRYPRVLPTVPHAVVFIIIMMVVVVMVGYGDGGVVVVLQIIHQLPSTVCASSK